MSDFKHKLDQMMGDTSEQERRIKQRVHENLHVRSKRRSWPALFVGAAIPIVAMLLFFTVVPLNQLSSDEGRGVPYDPLNDLAQISALQKKQQLSAIDYEEFASMPEFDQVDGLYYIDKVPFHLKGSSDTAYTVIERKKYLYDDIVYKPGDIVRTMTNTSSHLPTYDDVYYEVLAIPGDRVVLKDGKLRINGKPVKSDLMERYKAEGITIAGGYDQLLNAREYFLLNHFPASKTVQGATITPVHKIYGEVAGIATEERTHSIYLDYLSGQLDDEYAPEQYFDLYLYDELMGMNELPQQPALEKGMGELFLEASYRKVKPVSENEVELRYQFGREGVAGKTYTMKKDESSGDWVVGK